MTPNKPITRPLLEIGQGIAEYALIIALLAFAGAIGLGAAGSSAKNAYDEVASALTGGSIAQTAGDQTGGGSENNQPQQESDRDSDNVPDDSDNCPDTANANQADADQDGTGDACDYTHFVNIGTSTAQTDSAGNLWIGEYGLSTTGNCTIYYRSFDQDIASTNDDFIFQSTVHAGSGLKGTMLTWLGTDLLPGTYTVTLYFMEPTPPTPGVFDIKMQGTTVVSDYRPLDAGYYTASQVVVGGVQVTSSGRLEVKLKPGSYYPSLVGVKLSGTP